MPADIRSERLGLNIGCSSRAVDISTALLLQKAFALWQTQTWFGQVASLCWGLPQTHGDSPGEFQRRSNYQMISSQVLKIRDGALQSVERYARFHVCSRQSASRRSFSRFSLCSRPNTRYAQDALSTDRYLLQCFRRKAVLLLMITWVPLVLGPALLGTVHADVRRVWQALAVQVTTAVTFIATGSTPQKIVQARENAFGRAGRYMLIARPGRRDVTIAYTVDLKEERMLTPVHLSMGGVEAYQTVGELKWGPLGPIEDNEKIKEV